MADKPQEIIKRGVKVWNEWRRHNPGDKPNLDGAQLAQVDQSLRCQGNTEEREN